MDIELRKLGGARPISPSPNPSKSSTDASGSVAGDPSVKDSKGVSVTLTDTASRLQAAQQSLRQGPVFDPVRVAELKSAIASGAYHVDASRVAAKFMSLEANL